MERTDVLELMATLKLYGMRAAYYAAEQPLTALFVAAAIGYGVAYLIHRS
jgi:hypothetical protein